MLAPPSFELMRYGNDFDTIKDINYRIYRCPLPILQSNCSLGSRINDMISCLIDLSVLALPLELRQHEQMVLYNKQTIHFKILINIVKLTSFLRGRE